MLRFLSSNTGLLLFAGGVAVVAWFGWPTIRDRIAPSWGHSDRYLGPRRTTMHLDPDVEPGAIEDRRGERGGGGELGRLGPQWGPQGGGPIGSPWEESRGGFPGPNGDGRGGLRCRDSRTGQDIPLSYCDNERMGRR
jgi:hypothetical protein